MKRILGLLLMMTAFTWSAYAAAPAIVVTGLQGEAVLTVDGSDVPVKEGMEISEGGVLKSNSQGVVDVSIRGNSGFRFLPDTKAIFTSTDPKRMKIELENGNLLARFKNKVDPDSTFEVETPAAVLAVRGTQFWGRVTSPQENSMTSFAVRDGVVNVTAKVSGEGYILKGGDAIDLADDNTVPRLRGAAPAELAAIGESETIQI